MEFSVNVSELLKRRSLAYVATANEEGKPNVSLKTIVDYDVQEGILYFIDLFSHNTRNNLGVNNKIAISLVDYDKFAGFQFKGKAEMINQGPEFEKYTAQWHLLKANMFRDRIDWNLTRILKKERSELTLPHPKYLVKVKVSEVIDLAPVAKK